MTCHYCGKIVGFYKMIEEPEFKEYTEVICCPDCYKGLGYDDIDFEYSV